LSWKSRFPDPAAFILGFDCISVNLNSAQKSERYGEGAFWT